MSTITIRHLAARGLISVCAVGVLAGGCTADDFGSGGAPSAVPEGTLTAVFTISIPALSATTRADGESTAPGEHWESYIDLPSEDYRFLFFDKEGKFVETLQVKSISKASDDEINLVSTYYVEGYITQELAHKSDVKVLALANWGEYYIPREPGVTTVRDICESQGGVFEYTLAGQMPSPDNRIPLFGVTDPQTFIFNQFTHQAQMDVIHLLRAYSKIEIDATFNGYSDPGGCRLKEVTLSRHNTCGFKAPTGIEFASHYVSSSFGDLTSSKIPLHIPAGCESGESVRFVARPDDRNAHILYVPEYLNLTADGAPRDNRAEMHLTFEVPDRKGNLMEESALLEFKYYSDLGEGMKEGQYFNIARNVWYRYNVRKSPTNLIVDLQPYALAELRPDFGMERDRDGNILVRDENGKLIKVIPYEPDETALLKDIIIGDMSYVEVMFNDVLRFREFYDAKGRPTGERQDFLRTGWNYYDENGRMTRCFIYDTPKTAATEKDQTRREKGKYMLFDRFANLVEQWAGSTENADRTAGAGGTKTVWTKTDAANPDLFKIYYLDYENGKVPLQTILVVYDVKDGEKDTDRILTVLVEEGDATLWKDHEEIANALGEVQEVVEVYEKTDAMPRLLRYRFFTDGSSQTFSYNSSAGRYDWDFFSIDGWRAAGFDNNHAGYDNLNVYSCYDQWGNLISRSLEATDDAKATHATHNSSKMIVDSYLKNGKTYIKLRQRKSDGDWDWTDAGWRDTYVIDADGEKEVIY
ncbi:MAG: hypothetical protein K2O24_01400 [Muribaculaceae bacterium]|nr:hypothetical protein [Muribaculaceae bacterium]